MYRSAHRGSLIISNCFSSGHFLCPGSAELNPSSKKKNTRTVFRQGVSSYPTILLPDWLSTYHVPTEEELEVEVIGSSPFFYFCLKPRVDRSHHVHAEVNQRGKKKLHYFSTEAFCSHHIVHVLAPQARTQRWTPSATVMLSPHYQCPGRPTTPSKPDQFHYTCISAVHLKDQRTWAFHHASTQLFLATAASIKTEGFPFRQTLVGRLFHSVCANIYTWINVNRSRMFDFLSFSLLIAILLGFFLFCFF